MKTWRLSIYIRAEAFVYALRQSLGPELWPEDRAPMGGIGFAGIRRRCPALSGRPAAQRSGTAFQKYRVKPRASSLSLMRKAMRTGMPVSTSPCSTSVMSIMIRPPPSKTIIP